MTNLDPPAERDGLAAETVFIVFRAAPGVPPGFMPPGMDGRWEYRNVRSEAAGLRTGAYPAMAVALPTGRVEYREDDASAEVWEVHPIGGNYDPSEWRLPR